MSSFVSASLRKRVLARAQGKCEYCLFHQNYELYSHQVDHIIAEKHRGETTFDNLALSCVSCNRHKGSDLASIDPATGLITVLFNPRLHQWDDHFLIDSDIRIAGLTAIGRTTAILLQMNKLENVEHRRNLTSYSLYP
jgi:hypothetical protein